MSASGSNELSAGENTTRLNANLGTLANTMDSQDAKLKLENGLSEQKKKNWQSWKDPQQETIKRLGAALAQNDIKCDLLEDLDHKFLDWRFYVCHQLGPVKARKAVPHHLSHLPESLQASVQPYNTESTPSNTIKELENKIKMVLAIQKFKPVEFKEQQVRATKRFQPVFEELDAFGPVQRLGIFVKVPVLELTGSAKHPVQKIADPLLPIYVRFIIGDDPSLIKRAHPDSLWPGVEPGLFERCFGVRIQYKVDDYGVHRASATTKTNRNFARQEQGLPLETGRK